MSRLFLVRHAHARWEPDEDRPLSNRGRRDAGRVAELLGSVELACVYSSPARRAMETVQPLADRQRCSVVTVDDLRERELPEVPPGEFESAVRESWRRPDVGVEGGEPNRTAQTRGLRALRHMLKRHPGETLVAATHGNLLALVLNGLDPTFGYGFWRSMTFPDVYELSFEDARLSGVRRAWGRGENKSLGPKTR